MADWRSCPQALDTSHHNEAQAPIDWDQVAATAPACVFIKATERRWTSPTFERSRKALEDRCILWVPYVFLRPNDNDETFRYVIDLIGDRSIPVALDWEEPSGPGTNPVPPPLVERWIDALEADGGHQPICYFGAYPPAPATEKIGRCPRWYPQYPGTSIADSRLPMWAGIGTPDWRKCWLFWQWTDKGRVPGITGDVDLNRLACPKEMFEAWYRTGSFWGTLPESELPRPAPGEDPIVAQQKAVQDALRAAGFDPGPSDGWPGDQTMAAMRGYRRARAV